MGHRDEGRRNKRMRNEGIYRRLSLMTWTDSGLRLIFVALWL